MAARRTREEEPDEELDERSFWERWRGASVRRWATIPLILVLVAVSAWMLWKRHVDEVLSHETFQLDPQDITFTSPPDWLEIDVLPEVVKRGSLESLNLHDADLAVQVAQAFELHPWVKRCVRARKQYPAEVVVELEYRQPVGMVVLPDDNPHDTEAWLQPIDAAGVLLPGPDFSAEEVRRYPRIDVGIRQYQRIPLGSPWGDPIVADAGKLAELLHEHWDELDEYLYQIQLSSHPTSTVATPDFDVIGRPEPGRGPNLVVHWGRAPGRELIGEPSVSAKLAKLREWFDEYRRSGDVPSGEIDLRLIRTLSATVRPSVMR